MQSDDPVAIAAHLIRSANKVVALTGAGISTESGIADFRGPNGVWTKDPESEKLSHIHYYMTRAEVREKAWKARVAHPAWDAKPNPAHVALADLERMGRLHLLVTQNVDGLHQMAGSDPARVVEVHGTIWEVMCMSCDDRAPMQTALDRVRAGEADPPCRSCGGILKSSTVSFGQQLDVDDLRRAFEASGDCDVLIALGTTLTVYPIAQMADLVLESGGRLIIVNQEPTPYDEWAAVVLRGSLGETLPQIVGRI